MIRLNHVSKIYGDGSKKAVDDLFWDIEDGKITGFIGPNGAGKTTTLKMITGILAPSEGTIEILSLIHISATAQTVRRQLSAPPRQASISI